MRNLLGILLLVGACTSGAFPRPSAAATLCGLVHGVTPARKAPARYVIRGQSGSDANSDAAAATVAVALDPLDSPDPPQVPDTPLVMAQQNTTFVPNLLIVPIGGTVTFPNRDAFFHNVFSYSTPRSFDLGRYPRGETRTVQFTQPGIVRIFCEIHASMFATILVAPSSQYREVVPGEEFCFPNLAAGRYRVIAVDAAGRHARAEVELRTDEHRNLTLTLE
jgi:plastocyanin